MVTLKHLLGPVFHILPLSLVLILSGFLLIFKKKYGIGLFIGIGGLFLLYSFSLFPVSALLLRPLQTQYRLYQPSKVPAQYVVVLGGWHKTNRHIPLSSQLGRDSLMRIIEAIQIYRRNPGSKLVLSGGAPDNDPVSNANMMATLATRLGVPSRDIILEERPRDTKDEARYIRDTVKKSSFVLVTSAAHMQRAMYLFEKQGLFPHPAAVDYLLLDTIPFTFVPSAKALQSADTALHEYFGILWAWLRGQIVRGKIRGTTESCNSDTSTQCRSECEHVREIKLNRRQVTEPHDQ